MKNPHSINQIELDAPNIGILEKKYIERCLDSTFISTYGPYVPEFESNFSRFLHSVDSVAVQSGTAGLQMALYELGVGEGDEVILPVLTFIATANAVKYVGAKPIFVDVDPSTWTIDPALVEKAVTKRTRAVIPVHLFGNPCAMDDIINIANKYDLFIIEDATESLGSKYKGNYTGTFGDFGVFSFNGNKLITTGGGGMITGRDKERVRHIRFLINQARDEKGGYFHSEIGFNYRMTNLEASLGLAQLERLPEFIEKKIIIHQIYSDYFSAIENIRLQAACKESETIWWLTSFTIDPYRTGLTVSEIQDRLEQHGIPSRRIFTPISEFPPYFDHDKTKFPSAYWIFENGLNLPGSTINDAGVIEFTADVLIKVLNRDKII